MSSDDERRTTASHNAFTIGLARLSQAHGNGTLGTDG